MLRHAYKNCCPLRYSCLASHNSHQCPSDRHDASGVGRLSPQRNRHGAPRDTQRRVVQWLAACMGTCLGVLSLLSSTANNLAHPRSCHLVLASQSAYGHRAGIAGYVRRTRWRIRLWLSGIFLAHYGHCLSRWFSAALRLAQTCRVSFSTASLTEARPSASHHSFFPFAAASPALLSRLHPRRCAA